jgi:hypothetical protein
VKNWLARSNASLAGSNLAKTTTPAQELASSHEKIPLSMKSDTLLKGHTSGNDLDDGSL